MKSVAELDKKAERKAPSLLDQPRRCVPPGAGHFSASDRYKYLKELSFDYAWLLERLRLVDESPAYPPTTTA